MPTIVERHRRHNDGSYTLAIRDDNDQLHEFAWGPNDLGIPDTDYEAMQLREAKLLVDQRNAQQEPDEGEPTEREGEPIPDQQPSKGR